MTKTRYTVASLLQYFGVGRKVKRLTDASFEMHLMQDGEEILGAYCWKQIEEIEELSMEYWNLRQLERESKEAVNNIEEAEATLSEAQMERSGSLNRAKDTGKELLDQRDAILTQIEELTSNRDKLMVSATQTKRKHSTLKMKAEVLKEEGLDGKTSPLECEKELADIRELFSNEKEQLSKINSEISKLETTLSGVQSHIGVELTGSKGEETEAFAQISKANRDITNFKSELSIIKDKQALHFRSIGRFLNLNSKRADCRAASRKHRSTLEQTRLLHHSIELNRKLIEKMGG